MARLETGAAEAVKILKWVAVVGLIVALFACGIALVQYDKAVRQWQAEVNRLHAEIERAEIQAESNYYKGVFATCNVANLRSLMIGILIFDCDALLKRAYKLNWYELEAPGFEWPLQESLEVPGRTS